jgi:hypothetical protein
VGSFASDAGQALCTSCAAGSFANTTGQALCTSCAAGTFAGGTGQAECTACDAGSYSGTGASACSPCNGACLTCGGPSATDCTSCASDEPPVSGACLPACALTPATGCRLPAVDGKAKLKITDDADDNKDQLKWKWIKGSATQAMDFGDPLATDSYLLCIYDGSTRVSSIELPAGDTCAGKPCWKATASGFLYKDKDRTPEGGFKAKLKAGGDTKAGVSVIAKGVTLETPDPTTFTGPLRVQLQRADGAICFESVFSAPFKKNSAGKFSDSAD